MATPRRTRVYLKLEPENNTVHLVSRDNSWGFEYGPDFAVEKTMQEALNSAVRFASSVDWKIVPPADVLGT